MVCSNKIYKLAVVVVSLLIFSCSSSKTTFFSKKTVERHNSSDVSAIHDSINSAYRAKNMATDPSKGLISHVVMLGEISIDTSKLSSDTLLIIDSLFVEDDTIDQEEEDAVWGSAVEFISGETRSVGGAKYDVFGEDNIAEVSIDDIANNGTYPFGGILSSQYGIRRGRLHSGIDISARNGAKEIYAIMDGIVRVSMHMKGYGNLIVIRHENGLESLYAHNKKNLVKSGDIVRSGDQIAIVGSTGRSTAPHLHFEFRVMGKVINPNLILNPKDGSFLSGTLYLHKFNEVVIASSEKERSKIVIHKYHKIRSGDTLLAIARKYGVTVAKICSMNSIKTTTILKIGRQLKVT